jgi:hypothetical protein
MVRTMVRRLLERHLFQGPVELVHMATMLVHLAAVPGALATEM